MSVLSNNKIIIYHKKLSIYLKMREKAREIVSLVNENFKEILKVLKQEDIDFYCFIQFQFDKSKGYIKDKLLFQNLYTLYYNLRGFLGKKFFESYFSKFSEKDIQEQIKRMKNIDDLRVTLDELLNDTKNITEKYQYSFISKMIHTMNPKFPIYDKYIRIALKLKDPSLEREEKRLDIFWKTYKEIWDIYMYILENECLDDIIEKLSIKRDISELVKTLNWIKILDFLFWSLGKIIEK